jgi:hypothetical protein
MAIKLPKTGVGIIKGYEVSNESGARTLQEKYFVKNYELKNLPQ